MPSAGIENTSFGNFLNATTINNSAPKDEISSKKLSFVRFSGCLTGILLSDENLLTSLSLIFNPLPDFLSGDVTTHKTSKLSLITFNDFTAKSGVPKKIIFVFFIEYCS